MTTQSIPHFYTFTSWQSYPIIAGFSDKAYNFLPAHNQHAKRAFAEQIGFDLDRIVFPTQVHGNRVVVVGKDNKNNIGQADALITNQKNIPIAVITADCVPIYFYVPTTAIIAIVHAGWKGTHAKITHQVIEKIKSMFHVNVADIHVAIGPAIRKCCYKVKDNVAHHFHLYIEARNNALYCDLVRANIDQCMQEGIQPANILDAGICTCCNIDFHSYRRDGERAGRMMNVVGFI